MAEYMERDAFLDDISATVKHRGMGEIIGQTLMRYVKRQPAANVAPVVHGRWVDGKCSNCGVDIPTDDAHDAIFENECRFCYYCGAKMDGGNSDACVGSNDFCSYGDRRDKT